MSISKQNMVVPISLMAAVGLNKPRPDGHQMRAKAPAGAVDMNTLVQRVFERLPLDVPFVQPKHVAPIMGMNENQFTYHCRNCKQLRLWKGSYRFFLDDAEHMQALAAAIKLALWSARKLPKDLRLPTAKRVH